ncbi:MAG: carboxypeptidase regulatory-like domain-containing protein [Gemmatimonadaceae bacterium]|nr:carboxypeptidase regulatory-like domain-containing protein [Gemmatimonadaceae bacterium]
MRPPRFLSLVVVLLAPVAVPDSLRAQVARGTVTEQTSNAPLAGVVVDLVRADASGANDRVFSVLTDLSGTFALRASGPGHYRVTAKRIGVKRYSSAPFDLADGETRSLSIVLEALDYRLPEVVVSGTSLCSVNPRDVAQVAALWDEARAALDAAEISLRDKLFSAEVTRYVRELDPKSKRVLNETRSEVRGVVASPFNSAPAESLSVLGYWRAAPNGGAYYFGPDAKVLLSETFLTDHCFRPVAGKGARSGMVGLRFAPVVGRTVPDVAGALWLDAKTFELRLVDFAYDRVRAGVDSAAVGGEVHFARLASGAWIVRRWFLRVPVLGRPTQPLSTEGSAPWVLVRPGMSRLSEEGGLVTTDDLRPQVRPASISGVLLDSTGKRPLMRALVRIAGTPRTSVSGADGRFAFDSVAPGSYTLVVNTVAYDSLGLAAADVSLELTGGQRRAVQLSAHTARVLTERLCVGRGAPWGRGTLHVTVRDSVGGTPLPRVGVSVGWMSTIGRVAGDSVLATSAATTDEKGSIAFCEIPADRTLTIGVALPNGGASAEIRTALRAREVKHLDVTIAPR